MIAVPVSPLPGLPPEDHSLLTRYLSLNEDLSKLAAEPNTPDLLSLLRWLSRPDIAAYIAAYRTHQTHLHRQAVIASLRSVLDSSSDQIEIRRAATTLLRALNGGTTLRGVRPPSSPTGGGAGAAGGGGSVSTAFSTHSPHTRGTPSHHSPLNRSPSPPLTPSPIHPLTPSSPPQLTPAPPTAYPTSLSEALAILGLPADLDELDRLEDEADDAADDAELDAYADGEAPPLPTNTS